MVFLKNFIALALIVLSVAEADSTPHDKPYVPSLFFPELSKPPLSSSDSKDTLTPPDIHLDGIVWQSPQKWTVWINGEKATSQKPHPFYDIIHVTQNMVQVRQPDGQILDLKPGAKK